MIDYWNKEILVLGCGNILFGDDGFGPEVVEHFKKNYNIPGQAYVLNAGLSVREILFTLILSEKKPRRIIILDAVDFGKNPGEILNLDVSELPDKKTDDFLCISCQPRIC
jgi:coenzyme F420 hydrogenase subunit delta